MFPTTVGSRITSGSSVDAKLDRDLVSTHVFQPLAHSMKPAVSLQNISRHFGQVQAVDAVNLDIAEGEFFALLGPSGSGKTTCLRLIAGFEQPTSGSVVIFGEDATRVPPYRRPVNTVFQDYALFPHLNILDNVAYGLMVRGEKKAARRQASEEALSLVALAGFGGRKPSELSGGQRQRVALARALVLKPKVLLLDEPLGALDLKLREQMQTELKALQRRLGITFIFVTHDQGEALSMADRVAVFDRGHIQQIGAPQNVYDRPETPFVADFVGSSNVLPAHLVAQLIGETAPASLRPEQIHLTSADGKLSGKVIGSAFLGAATRLELDVEGNSLSVLLPKAASVPELDSTVHLTWDKDALHVMRGPDV
ncbi:putative spermidine/putrescine transport system ATP-binding protein [Roseibium denhamense]|uniref:Spermidine/putrescine transport system ATP-binding protein n=2 Tax=Roseibium denhamense TaxID=76305 RepID=A0ABY1NCX7_9HYPH|nr:putative spermidine/putrescine transport system ATP-binding protein [Roseibium denhamense]